MERTKRSLTLTAAILNIISYSIYILFTILALYQDIAFLLISGNSGIEATLIKATIAFFVLIYGIRLALGISMLILSAKLIKISRLQPKEFLAKRTTMNACYVINIIIVTLGIIAYLNGNVALTTIGLLIDVVLWTILVLASVLIAVDRSKAQKELASSPVDTVSSI